MTIYAFDFDGTLTRRDTFLVFARFAKGTSQTFFAIMLMLPLLVMMKLRLYPNWRAKQQLFSLLFRGMAIDQFDETCRRFAAENQNLLRPKGLQTIERAIGEGSKVVVITASIENWVKPFFHDLSGDIRIEGTRIDVRNGKLTGKFLTKNCYGREKLKRIKKLYPARSSYRLIAFGDSKGDSHLLRYADEKHYKPFRH